MTSRPILHFDQLTSDEAKLLHPAVWDGHTVGVGEAKRYSQPDVTVRNAIAIKRALGGVNVVMQRAARRLYRPDQIVTLRPGDTYEAALFAGRTVIFDQSTLLSRGRPAYALNAREFMGAPAQLPPVVGPAPYVLKQEHMLYLRAPSPIIELPKNDPTLVRNTRLENYVGLRDYPLPVGIQEVPATMEVGTVGHFVMSDGHEMLTRTHNVYVFPPA